MVDAAEPPVPRGCLWLSLASSPRGKKGIACHTQLCRGKEKKEKEGRGRKSKKEPTMYFGAVLAWASHPQKEQEGTVP